MKKAPRDFHVANRTGLIKFARIYSNVVSPPVMFAVLGLVIAIWAAGTLREAIGWWMIYGFFASLAPIIFVAFLLRSGRIAELHMSNTGERHLPYISAFIFAIMGFAILTFLDGPEALRCLALFNVVELTALGIINAFWLISLHSTGIMATMTIVWLLFGVVPALFVLPVVISVVWVRLYLKRHTPAQVVAGLGLGVVSVLSLMVVSCF